MAYEDLRERGLVEEVKPDLRTASRFMARAQKDLATARANVSIDKEWAYAIAYGAMFRAAKAALAAEGWRPKGRDQPRTIVLLIGELLGEESRTLVNAFDLMRRKRQQFLEEGDRPIPRYEVEAAVKDAQMFVERLREVLRDRNPQLTLM